MSKSDDKDLVRKIWLAGIGAYGRAFTEAKGAMDSLTGKSSEVFEELVSKGEIVEAASKYKAEELLGKGKAAMEDMRPDFDIDDRIARMRERLSGGADNSQKALAERVDQIEAKLDAILAKLDAGKAPTKRPVKTATKRKSTATSKTASKPASKKRMTTQKTTKTKKTPTKKS